MDGVVGQLGRDVRVEVCEQVEARAQPAVCGHFCRAPDPAQFGDVDFVGPTTGASPRKGGLGKQWKSSPAHPLLALKATTFTPLWKAFDQESLVGEGGLPRVVVEMGRGDVVTAPPQPVQPRPVLLGGGNSTPRWGGTEMGGVAAFHRGWAAARP